MLDAVGGDQVRNACDRAKILDLQRVKRNLHEELPLDLEQQRDQRERIEKAGLDEVGVCGRGIEAERLLEETFDPDDDVGISDEPRTPRTAPSLSVYRSYR